MYFIHAENFSLLTKSNSMHFVPWSVHTCILSLPWYTDIYIHYTYMLASTYVHPEIEDLIVSHSSELGYTPTDPNKLILISNIFYLKNFLNFRYFSCFLNFILSMFFISLLWKFGNSWRWCSKRWTRHQIGSSAYERSEKHEHQRCLWVLPGICTVQCGMDWRQFLWVYNQYLIWLRER